MHDDYLPAAWMESETGCFCPDNDHEILTHLSCIRKAVQMNRLSADVIEKVDCLTMYMSVAADFVSLSMSLTYIYYSHRNVHVLLEYFW